MADSGSTFGKILLIIGAAALPLLKLCTRTADDVARIGTKGLQHSDEVVRGLDDVARYGDEAVHFDDVLKADEGLNVGDDVGLPSRREGESINKLIEMLDETNALDDLAKEGAEIGVEELIENVEKEDSSLNQ